MCQNYFEQFNTPEINDLRYRRDLLKDKIKGRVDSNKDARSLVLEYFDMTNKLSELGFNIPSRAKYLTLEYWKLTNDDVEAYSKAHNTTESSMKKKETKKAEPDKKINIQPEQSYYIFNLSWSVIELRDQEETIEKIIKYLKYMGLKEVRTDKNINVFHKEVTVVFEKECTYKEYQTIKKSAQYYIDVLAKDDLTRRNMAVYGRKKEIN